MVKYLLLTFQLGAIILFIVPSHAQYENIWAFGYPSGPQYFAPGLDFNTNNSPQVIPTKMVSGLGSATVCNSNGDLLFYTNGHVVWDRAGNVMPGGQGITPYMASSGVPTDAALIVPMDGSPDKYYLFSITTKVQNRRSDYGKLFYSIVDMSLNNGWGDIQANSKGILVDSGLGTHLTAVVGDRCNVWVLVCALNRDIKAYEITSSGLNPDPVITPDIGPGYRSYGDPHFPGTIKASPDRKKLAATILGIPFLGDYGKKPTAAFLYDFDPASGKVSNPLSLLDFGAVPGYAGFCDAYGACFSPDNSKLYINYGVDYPWPAMDIVQFDLSSGNPSAILGSKVILGYNGWFSDIKQGPDNKLYFLYTDPVALGTDMGSISAPNLSGASSLFMSFAFPLRMPGVFNGNWAYGLPNVVPLLEKDTLYHTHHVKGDCAYTDLLISARDTSGWDYVWQDGVVGSYRSIDAEGGLFYVSYTTAPCVFHRDTIIIEPWQPFPVELGNDTMICNEESFTLSIQVDGASYYWQDGSRDSKYSVTRSGVYRVEVTKDGCTVTDSIKVSVIDVIQDLGADLKLCKEKPVQVALKARAPEGAALLWSTGSKEASIIAVDTGTYWVTATLLSCTGTDSLHISAPTVCECHLSIPNAFSPNKDGRNDIFKPVLQDDCPVDYYQLHIYNRFGKRIYSGLQVDNGWDGTYPNGEKAEMGTYYFELQFRGGTNKTTYYQKGDVTLIR